MNIKELEDKFLSRKRNTGTIFDNGYDKGIDDCLCLIDEFIKNGALDDISVFEVDHSSHYNRDGAMECINEMIEIFGLAAVIDFCKCNVWKYRYRAGFKGNGKQDLEKSDWYIRKFEELKEVSTWPTQNVHGKFLLTRPEIDMLESQNEKRYTFNNVPFLVSMRRKGYFKGIPDGNMPIKEILNQCNDN